MRIKDLTIKIKFLVEYKMGHFVLFALENVLNLKLYIKAAC